MSYGEKFVGIFRLGLVFDQKNYIRPVMAFRALDRTSDGS